ncbi:ATP-binding protein [Saccharomonospora sp. NPDC006951]
MRTWERRVADAITGLLMREGPDPDPRELVRAAGEAAGAAGCALVIGGRRFQWGGGEGSWLEHEVTYDGEVRGVLSFTPGSLGPFPSVAAVLGPLVAAIELTEETDRLRREGDAAARELVDDRWRAAAEMEHQRRGLERDLHDGAQHHLVALRMSLAVAEHTIGEGAGRERIADLLAQLENAERVLVETAEGILPGALVADGLVAALRAQLSRYDTVTLDASGLARRYPAPVESAVYFVVLEAVNNARKHAPGARVLVAVADSYQGLEFTVADDGPGFDVTGAGLPGLTTRVASVGGSVQVRSAAGAGTTVDGIVPV